ncbi:hypothetical protein [Mycoplasmopsis edwardii]|uniref:Uncharacterized protein n=1 Tax=Mycoplasmopsis edwardii TaxID=53558 RepID=A0ACD4PHB2_9BACT|nr:hypothetical protein [Mycoplasmopsis edwardii]WBP83886.1 hypothetical protein Me_995_000512 [Mycoplasmopsis edwardii]
MYWNFMEPDEVGIFINDNGEEVYDNHDNECYEEMLSETFRKAHDFIKEKPIINKQKIFELDK